MLNDPKLKIVYSASLLNLAQTNCIITFKQLIKMFPNHYYAQISTHNSLQTNQAANFIVNRDYMQQINTQIQVMIQREEFLVNEVKVLREQLQRAKGVVMEAAITAIQQQFAEQTQKAKKLGQQRNVLRKNLLCPVKGCPRKYSSTIALRAHIKKGHAINPRSALEGAELKP